MTNTLIVALVLILIPIKSLFAQSTTYATHSTKQGAAIGFMPAKEQQRYLIQFHPHTAASTTDAASLTLTEAKHYINKSGGQVVHTLHNVHAVAAYLSPSVFKRLTQDVHVRHIEKDPQRKLQAYPSKKHTNVIATPSDITPQSNAIEITPYGLSTIQADGNYIDTSESQKVCIIDTGYDVQHNDLMQGEQVTGDVIASFDSDGTAIDLGEWSSDSYGQGTHIAGTLSALGNNGIGIKGVASTGVIPLHHVKVIHKANYWTLWGSDLIAALEKCQQSGANIVNISLSGSTSSHIEAEAFANAWNAGIMVFAAAGNRGNSEAYFPASYPEVISVGATTESNHAWQFTQKNTHIELVAPGEYIYSTLPNNQYRAWDGSGVAVPYVTGVAALAWGKNPQCDASTVRAALQQSALDLGAPGRDNTFGYGLVQLQNTLDTISNAHCQVAPTAPIFHHVVQVDSNESVDIPFATSTIIVPPQYGQLETAPVGVRYVASIDFNGFDYFTMLSAQGEETVVQIQVGQPAESTFYLDNHSHPLRAVYDNGTLLTIDGYFIRRRTLSGELIQVSERLSKHITNLAVLPSGQIVTVGKHGSPGIHVEIFDRETLQLTNSITIPSNTTSTAHTSYEILPKTSGGFTLFWPEPGFISAQQFSETLTPLSEVIHVAGNPDGNDKFDYYSSSKIAVAPSKNNTITLAYGRQDGQSKRYSASIVHLSTDLKTQTHIGKWDLTSQASALSLAVTSTGDTAIAFAQRSNTYLGVVNAQQGQQTLISLSTQLGTSAPSISFYLSTINDKWLLRWRDFDQRRFFHYHTKAVLLDEHGDTLHDPVILSAENITNSPVFTTSTAHGRVIELGGRYSSNYTINWFTPQSWVSTSVLKQSPHAQNIVNQLESNTQAGNDIIQNVNRVNSGTGRDHIINGEQINAGAGDDRIEVFTQQQRTIDGGEGFDLLVVNGEQNEMQLLNNPDGSFQLIDTRETQNAGNNHLINIEAIAFKNSQLLLQSSPVNTVTHQWTLPINTQHTLPAADTILVQPTHGTLQWRNGHWHYLSTNTIGTDNITYRDIHGQIQQLNIQVGAPSASQQLPLEHGSTSRVVAGNNGEVFIAWNNINARKRYFTRLDTQQTKIYKAGTYLPSSYQNHDLQTDIAVSPSGHYGVVYNYGNKHYMHNYSDTNRSVHNTGVSSAANTRRFTGQITAMANGTLLNLTQYTSNDGSKKTYFRQKKLRIDAYLFRPIERLLDMPPLQTSIVSSTGLENSTHLVAAAFDHGVQYQILTEYGLALSDIRTASTHTLAPTDEPQPVATAAQANGGFIIAWTQTGAIDGEGTSIALRYFAEDGTPTTDTLNVNQTTEGNQQGVRLTTLADGRVAVVWWSESGDGDGKASFIRWFDKDGNPQSDEQLIMADTAGDQHAPDITTLSDNRVLVSLTSRGNIIRVFPSPSTHGNDVFYSYAPMLEATQLNNLVNNSLYYGNAGDDSVLYPGDANDYSITTLPNGEQHVMKPNGSIDRLFSIEHIGFYTDPLQ